MTTRDAILDQIRERDDAQRYRQAISEAAAKARAERDRRSERTALRQAKRAATWAQSVFSAGPL